MESGNLLTILSIFHVMIIRGNCNDLLPVVLKFYDLREITSINAFLCSDHSDAAVYRGSKVSFSKSLTCAKVFETSYLDDLSPMFESQTYRIGNVFDLSCPGAWDLLEMVSDQLLINTSYAYALIMNEPIEVGLNKLERMNVQFDSDITIFTNNSEIYDLFRTAEGRKLTANRCGEWNTDLVMTYSKPPRWNLDGVIIRATTVVTEFKWEKDGIQKFVDSQYHPEIDVLSRFAVATQYYLEHLYNFKTNLTTSPNWGYFRPETGRFDPISMFGLLEEGKVDLGISISRQFSSRLSVSFYAPATYTFHTSVLFRHPPAGASYDGFARPFSLTTWLVTFLFIFIASLVLKAISSRDVEDDPPNEPEYSYSLFNVLAILSLQGTYVNSLRIPTRVLSAILHFFGLLVYSYYGAEVVGFLLSPSPRTLTTVEKLVDSPLDLWVENVSFHINHFESGVGAKATKYYNLAIKGPTHDKDKIMDREKALKNVKKGGFALYGISSEMFQIIQNTFTGPEICSLYIMDMLTLIAAVAVRKKSPYREVYNKGLLRFMESGFKNYEDKKWHAPKPVCYGSEDTAPVALEATLIAQMIFVGGFLMSLIFYLVEKGITRRKMLVKNKNRFTRNDV